jgi:dolichol-phosphate mannosyltransferase
MQTLAKTLTRSLPRYGSAAAPATLTASVVLSVADEEGNVLPLVAEIVKAMDAIPAVRGRYEIVFVDDLSRDNTREEIAQAMRIHGNIRLIRHQSRYGKSQGVWTGLRFAKGEWIVTMDGDGQNDPADISKLLDVAFSKSKDANILVSGWRVNRQGTASKRWASRIANGIRRNLLKDDCPDTGCALKVFRRDAYLALPYFDGIHRYEPTLFRLYGHTVEYVPVNDRARLHGVSKYNNLKRAMVGVFDLIGLMWLQSRFKGRKEQSVEVELLANEKTGAVAVAGSEQSERTAEQSRPNIKSTG